MHSLTQPLLLTGVVILLGQTLLALADPHEAGPCAARLQSLGYTLVELDATRVHASLYEARRGSQKVKLMVDNGPCTVRQTWLDD